MQAKWRSRWVVGALAGGLLSSHAASSFAACTWIGAVGGNKSWSASGNWTGCGGSYPTGDAELVVPTTTGHTTCEYDSGAPNTVGVVTITGDAPTAFTLHVKDKSFQPATLKLNDYSKMDADQCTKMTGVPGTLLNGSSEIDAAASTPCWLGDAFVQVASAVLRVIGIIDADDFTIGADVANASLSFRLKGTGTLDVNDMAIISEWGENETARTAGLILESGSLTPNRLMIHAGQGASRKAYLDVDVTTSIRNRTCLEYFENLASPPNEGSDGVGGGEVTIDIESGKTLDLGQLYIQGPCTLRVTGTATTPGQVITSGTESASEESAPSCN